MSLWGVRDVRYGSVVYARPGLMSVAINITVEDLPNPLAGGVWLPPDMAPWYYANKYVYAFVLGVSALIPSINNYFIERDRRLSLVIL